MKQEIYFAEALSKLKQIENNSIDLVLCDLPYGVTQNRWDSLIPLNELWKEYHRIGKLNCGYVLFAQDKFTVKLMSSNLSNHKYNLIWEKDRPSGFLNAKRQPLRSHEDICVFYRKQVTYNPQKWVGKPLHGMGSKFKQGNANNNYNEFDSGNNPSALREGDTAKFPRSVLKFSKVHPQVHPTQKPVELLEYLIKTYSNENELVLDNCAGSGSTALACINTNRSFIMIENDPDYYALMCERVQKRIKAINAV